MVADPRAAIDVRRVALDPVVRARAAFGEHLDVGDSTPCTVRKKRVVKRPAERALAVEIAEDQYARGLRRNAVFGTNAAAREQTNNSHDRKQTHIFTPRGSTLAQDFMRVARGRKPVARLETAQIDRRLCGAIVRCSACDQDMRALLCVQIAPDREQSIEQRGAEVGVCARNTGGRCGRVRRIIQRRRLHHDDSADGKP